MKKIVLMIALFALASFPAVTHADEGWKITNFTDQLAVQADGHVNVTETIAVDFNTLQKHGIFRELPYRYRTDSGQTINTDITNLSVTNGSVAIPYSLSHDSSTLTIKIGDPNQTVSGTQQYVLKYTETGVLRAFQGYDELYWNATGNAWPVPIDAATANVLLPDSVTPTRASCYQGDVGSTEPCNQVDLTHFATSRHLGENQGLTIAVGYPSGAVPLLTGSGQLPDSLQITTAFLLELVGSFFLICLLGIGWLIRQYRKSGRDESAGPSYRQTVIAEYEPPADLRPGELGVLMDERADTLDLTATIIDLANRGFLTVKEIPKSGVFGKRDYELTRTKKGADGLMGYESTLLNALFSAGSPVRTSTLRSNSFALAMQQVKSKLYQELTDKQLFAANPATVRTKYLALGSVFIAISVVGITTGLSALQPLLLGGTSGLILVGVATLISSFAMPKRSAKGTEAFRQAKGYKLFLTTVEKDRVPFFEKEGAFMQVMPYAMVFGVATLFAKRLADLGANPQQPGWYYGSSPFSPIIFASDMNAFSNQMNSAFAPVSSGSGSGGGGFSGGGFGGGGGGSW